MPSHESIEDIYHEIFKGREENLLRDDLRKLFKPLGMTYHHPSKQNQMFRKPEMMKQLSSERAFELIRVACTMLVMADQASILC